MSQIRLMRIKAVLAATAVGRTTHYAHIKNGVMTVGFHVGDIAVAWPSHGWSEPRRLNHWVRSIALGSVRVE